MQWFLWAIQNTRTRPIETGSEAETTYFRTEYVSKDERSSSHQSHRIKCFYWTVLHECVTAAPGTEEVLLRNHWLVLSNIDKMVKAGSVYENISITNHSNSVQTKRFTLMTARHYSLSLTKQNFNAFSDDLRDMMEIMKHAKFGEDGRWTPFQRGFIISSTSILDLTKFLLIDRNFDFFFCLVVPSKTV